jgi:tyrosyl-tRNA synthetase
MSKSLGNYVGIDESPQEIFGKLMSVSDELMWRYIELLSFEPLATIAHWKEEVRAGRNPRDVKAAFAQEIVARFHGAAAAAGAIAEFDARFREGMIPDDIPEIGLDADGNGAIALPQVLKRAGLTASTSDALRMIDQGGVRVDGDRVSDRALNFVRGAQFVVQVGKRRFARVVIR